MKKVLFLSVLVGVLAFSSAVVISHNSNIEEVKAVSDTAFKYQLGGSQIVKDFVTAFNNKGDKTPEEVALKSTNGEFTYGVAYGNLYGNSINYFDSTSNSALHSSAYTTSTDIQAHACAWGTTWGNPYIYSGSGEGFIFWFKANEPLTFTMPAFTIDTVGNGSTSGQIFRKIFLKKDGASSFSQAFSQQLKTGSGALDKNVQAINEVAGKTILSTGDMICFEFRRPESSSAVSIQKTSIPFVLSNYYKYAKQFTDDYMHIGDSRFDGDGTGLCSKKDGTGKSPYEKARDAFNELPDEVRAYFLSEDEASLFLAPSARLLEWARINGESLTEAHTFARGSTITTTTYEIDSSVLLLIGVLITAALAGVSYIVIITNRRHN